MTSISPCRKYLYFAGLGTGPKGADGFIANAREAGVPDDRVVLHECPYPEWTNDPNRFTGAIRNTGRFLGSMRTYTELTRPESPVARREYDKVLHELQAAHVSPDDPLTIVAHSAGGQEACVMARLLSDLSPYHVDTVVLMASPVLSNLIPTDMRVVAVVNAADPVTTDAGKIPGLQLNGIPKNLGQYPDHVVMTVSPDPAPNASQHGRYFEPDILRHILDTANPMV